MKRTTPNRSSKPFATAAVAFALLSYATAAFAVGTEEQRRACTPDVFRLCASDIPSVDRIVACMRRQQSQLSPACAVFFQGSPQTRSISEPGWCQIAKEDESANRENWVKWCAAP